MEKRLNRKIEDYLSEFKNNIRNKINELTFDENNKINELLEYIYDYQRLSIQKDDLVKRKRVKNSIPLVNRCNAKRSNGKQCTRRRKENCEFCGTHVKGTPHGLIENDIVNENVLQKLDVFVIYISGIVYYIDHYNNVYNTEDILESKENPRIVAKYVKEGENYSIPEFGIM
jgi:hypothetical protein